MRTYWVWIVVVGAVAIGGCPKNTRMTSAPGNAPRLGVHVDVPSDATVDETGPYTHVGNGTFKLNLFPVGPVSPRSAAEQRALVQMELGFAKLTREDAGATTWRFDYELTNGMAATISRIDVGRPLDCGVYGVTREIADAVAASCAGARRL